MPPRDLPDFIFKPLMVATGVACALNALLSISLFLSPTVRTIVSEEMAELARIGCLALVASAALCIAVVVILRKRSAAATDAMSPGQSGDRRRGPHTLDDSSTWMDTQGDTSQYATTTYANDGHSSPSLHANAPWPTGRSNPHRKMHLRWSVELLRELEWKRFEDVCVAFFKTIDFTVEVSSHGAQRGTALRLKRQGQLSGGSMAFCRQAIAGDIDVEDVRAFFILMAETEVAKGYYVTSGDFTPAARELVQGTGMHLVNADAFVRRIRSLAHEKRHPLLKLAITGDYHTPTCEQCGKKMTQRTTAKRATWVCSDDAACRHRMTTPAMAA